MAPIRILQANLQHSKSASAELTVAMRRFDVALIQEPWVYKGKIRGLSGIGGELIYSRSADVPRTCIIVKRNIKTLPLINHCSRDLTTVKMKIIDGGGVKQIVFGSAYLPYDDPEQPPSRELEQLVRDCRKNGLQLIIGCDANAHHLTWGSTNTNARGESVLQFIMQHNLDILNVGNKPTFVTSRRKEVIDITVATTNVARTVKNWHVSDEVSFSDHRHICFEMTGNELIKETYRNPRKTNWEAYQADIEYSLGRINGKIRHTLDLDMAAEQFQEIVTSAFEDNCPEIVRNSNRKVPWWNHNLANQRTEVRRKFNFAKRSGEWGDYRKALTDYNKELRRAKRESWRRHCEEIEGTSEMARLHKVLSKDPQISIPSLQKESGEYTQNGEDTLKELFRVHFPESETKLIPLDTWQTGLDIMNYGSRENWHVAKEVINQDKIKWAINSFEPYKSPGPDGIYPILLQKGNDLLFKKLCKILQASLGLGYIPKAWRLIRVAFIPKPGKIGQERAKSLRPLSLMSFVLKTLEKLLDRHIRDGVLVESPIHRGQYAYRAGVSTETALHHLVQRVEYVLENQEVMLGAFLDIEGAFDNTSYEAITRAIRLKGIDETSCRWIDCMLRSRVIYATLLGDTVSAQVARGCPQGGVLSPLLWNLVMDGLIARLDNDRHHVLGYADDLVILAHGKFNGTVRDRMQQALTVVTEWTSNVGLNISPLKSKIMKFTKRRNSEELGPLSLNGIHLNLVSEVKYLGIILDSRLTWNQQIERITKRAVSTLMVARRTHGKMWGLRPDMVYWTYNMVVKPTITYASVVWWPKVQQKSAIIKLSKVQRLACLGITGAMRGTPTAAMEALLDLPPLHITIRGEARMGYYRLRENLSNVPVKSGHSKITNEINDAEWMMISDHMTSRYMPEVPFQVDICPRDEWDRGNSRPRLQGCTWYTDGSKTADGSGAGIFYSGGNFNISIPLGECTSVFQTEIFAILQCARENNLRAFELQRVNICTDSQAAIGALISPKVNSRLVWECRQELDRLAQHNSVILVWVPGHRGIYGNERADALAKRASATKYLGPEPAVGVPKSTVRERKKAWIRSQHNSHWESVPGQTHGKMYIGRTCASRAELLLKTSRNQLRVITGFLTGHAPVKGHLHTMGLFHGDLSCRLCNREPETVNHILHDCEALDRRRQTLFGDIEMTPKLYGTHPLDLYKLVQGSRILEWVS